MSYKMKSSRLILIALCLIVAAGIGFAAYKFSNNYLINDKRASANRCNGSHGTHKVVILGNQVIPQHTEAKVCDKLVITNEDSAERLMAFGPHDHHISYDGVTERLLTQDQSLNVTLIQIGTFTFHDHADEQVIGSFTVSN